MLPNDASEIRPQTARTPTFVWWLVFSDFTHTPLMSIEKEHGLEVIRVSRCTSIAHAIAAIALSFREVGQPPELIFGCSDQSPIAPT
jgi:hypothetical protein